ncbi:hypothetical protein D9M69_401940 [compost metagenome]
MFILFDDLRTDAHVVEEPGQHRRAHGQQCQGFADALPQPYQRTDRRVIGQAGVQPWRIGVVQHVHHVGAADAFGVVQAGVFKTPALEVDDTLGRMFLHVVLGAEHDGTGRAGFHAGRLQPYRHPVRAQGAFVGLVILLRDPWNVERTPGDAIAATDAMILIEIDDAIGVLDDRPRAGACRQATGLCAVHAAILADQPFQVTGVGLVLGEAHQCPGFCGEILRIVVGAMVMADLVTQLVPFRAGDLAGLATDAFGGVDQLGDFLHAAHRGRRCGGGRAGNDVLAGHLDFLHVDQE